MIRDELYRALGICEQFKAPYHAASAWYREFNIKVSRLSRNIENLCKLLVNASVKKLHKVQMVIPRLIGDLIYLEHNESIKNKLISSLKKTSTLVDKRIEYLSTENTVIEKDYNNPPLNPPPYNPYTNDYNNLPLNPPPYNRIFN